MKSMTAFVRVQGEGNLGQFVWEIRAVNHRYLDISFKMSDRFRELEARLREIISQYLQRGKVDCLLRYQQETAISSETFQLNDAALNQLQKAHQQIQEKFNTSIALNLNDILQWPGVMKIDESDQSAIQAELLNLFRKAMIEFDAIREREGKQLAKLLEQRLDEIKKQIQKAQNVLPKILELQREKLMKRFEEAKVELNAERLEQEMVFVAQKVDVTEELDRLVIHVDETSQILKSDNPCGRRLDFLMQEFNREANTLGSKSISDVTTSVSLELKVLIEQMREQVQNIE